MTGAVEAVDPAAADVHGPRHDRSNQIPWSPSARSGSATTLPLALIAGPCVLESRAHAFDMAGALKEIAARRGIGFVYKTSFDKANRTSTKSARGLGLDKALEIFTDLRDSLGVPVLTDVHEPDQCAAIAEVVDILQIPAFLCRQTDLLVAAAKTGRAVNVKKGQFLAPWDMANVVDKITARRQSERARDRARRVVRLQHLGLRHARIAGAGENRRAGDLRRDSLGAAARAAKARSSGGEREFVPVLARAAVAVGVAGVFIETHQDPDRAPSDGPNMLPLKEMEPLLERLMAFDALAKRADGSPVVDGSKAKADA